MMTAPLPPSGPDPCVPTSIRAIGRGGEPTLVPPYIPSYGGHEGGFCKPGPNQPGCRGHHTMSSGIDIPAYCSRPVATGLVLVGPRTHRKVPPLSSLDRCLDRLNTSRLRGTPPPHLLQTPQPYQSLAHSPFPQLAPYPPGATAWSGGTGPWSLN